MHYKKKETFIWSFIAIVQGGKVVWPHLKAKKQTQAEQKGNYAHISGNPKQERES